jgi:phosphoglycerate dehydrogenase-like enzyme
MTNPDPNSSPVVATTHPRISAALICSVGCPSLDKIFNEARRRRIAQTAELLPVILNPQNFDQYRAQAERIEILFATWGIPAELLTPKLFPALRAVFYGGGTIKGFGRPLLERGVEIITAKTANALCVAQFCLGQILLSGKGYFRNTRAIGEIRHDRAYKPFVGAGLYGEKIALLGMGAVARELVALLRPFQLQIIAVDPYLSASDAAALGVRSATMEDAFAEAYVISNHLPDLPDLKGILDHRLLATMRPGATFINTGRGAQVKESDLITVARSRPDLTMLLDVTDPEPPEAHSPLYDLPNVQLSSHLAGASNDDLGRFGELLVQEFERFSAGQPLRHAESLDILDRTA